MKEQERLGYLNEYINIIIDIMCSEPSRWVRSSSRHQLPSFDYYIKNCIIDKGGKYDFTKRNYRTHFQILNKSEFYNIKTELIRYTQYSIWMGTEFNFKEVCIRNQ